MLSIKAVDEVIIGAPWKVSEYLLKNFNISLVVEGSMTKMKYHEKGKNMIN